MSRTAGIDRKSAVRNRVQGLILRHDVPIMQSPLKPLIDPKSWTKSGRSGQRALKCPMFRVLTPSQGVRQTTGHGSDNAVRMGTRGPNPPKGVGRSRHVFLMRVVLTSISPLAFIAATARCHCFRLASSAPVNRGSTSFRPSLRVNHPAGNSANIS